MSLSWKRKIFEPVLFIAGRFVGRGTRPERPQSIFLFNPGHIGDMLIHTPLFHALRRRFPEARMVVGCGPWNLATLKNNPDIDEVIAMSAPWNSLYASRMGKWPLTYILADAQVRELRQRHFDVGFDLLGMQWSALLLTRLAIPYRVNIRGPGGGFTAMSATVPHGTHVHAADTSLRFAEVLGVTELPPLRPRLFLTEEETAAGQGMWQAAGASDVDAPRRRRIVLGPAGSQVEKCWPDDRWEQLARRLSEDERNCVIMVGGDDVLPRAARISTAAPKVINRVTALKLRETFALVHAADIVVGNSNMLMHVAAAFGKPAVVLLSTLYDSAAEHSVHWGYDDTIVLGCEPDGKGIATVDEAMAAVLGAVASDTILGRTEN